MEGKFNSETSVHKVPLSLFEALLPVITEVTQWKSVSGSSYYLCGKIIRTSVTGATRKISLFTEDYTDKIKGMENEQAKEY